MSARSVETIDMSYRPHPLVAWEAVKFKNKMNQKSKSRIMEEHFNDVWSMIERKSVTVEFHHSIRWTLLLINNVIPLFPVSGVMARTPKNLSCNKTSIRYIFNTILLVLGITELLLTIRLALKLGFGVSASASLLFYFVTVIAGLLLQNLAKKWPKLMQYWGEKEEIFLKSPYSSTKHNPTKIMTFIAVFVFLAVLVEHTFFHIKSVEETVQNIKFCNLTGKVDFYEHFYKRERGHIADVLPYNIWLMPLLEWQNFAFALSWSYIDVIIVNISIGITTRFKQFSHRVNGIQNLNLSEDNWLYLRKQYGALTDLVFEVNSHISSLILLSSGNNLYFIVVNIFRGFTPRTSTAETIHFLLIMFLMIFRTLIMLFATASIHDASREIVNTLRKVPQKSWNFELERFINQIESQTIALTGKNMFKLTRKLILAFIGSIITFEIALLDQVESEKSNIDDCHATF